VLKTRADAQCMVNAVLKGVQGRCRRNNILLSKANGHDFYDKDERALPGIFQGCKISFRSVMYV